MPLNPSARTRPRAIIFDMDGLLVDSERTTRQVWQASTIDSGFALTDEMYLTLIGLGAEEAERVLAGQFGDGFVVAVFRARRVARMRDLLAAGGAPFKPGAREILAWIASLGIPAGLATSSRRQEVLERLGEVADLFATIRPTRDTVARGKPHPDIYLAAAASLGVEPADCLALEDFARRRSLGGCRRHPGADGPGPRPTEHRGRRARGRGVRVAGRCAGPSRRGMGS